MSEDKLTILQAAGNAKNFIWNLPTLDLIKTGI